MKNSFILLLSVIIVGLVVVGCDSENPIDNTPTTQEILAGELAKVKSATDGYQNLGNALGDEYVDIELFVPNMGWHYLKENLLDDIFDMEKPEILVYGPGPDGSLILVAVEYAVPVALSPDAPAGFTGEEDEWHINQDFGLWVLHAWVWSDNPDGMFNDTNPLVTQDQLEGELSKVRSATDKYHNVDNALAEGYVDIELIVPNMGAHFLKEDLLDDTFDMANPEILVYAPESDGSLTLVAVEYAVPVELSPDAPEGFIGAEDEWHINEDFGLWVLHAWVWYDNPSGMFNDTNPLVP